MAFGCFRGFRAWFWLSVVLRVGTLHIPRGLLELGALGWNRYRAWFWFSVVLRVGTLHIIPRGLLELGALGWNRYRAWLWLSLVLRVRTLHIISRQLLDYDAISGTASRNERCNTKIPTGTTTAFDVVGELDGQRFRTCSCRVLRDMSQYVNE